MWATMLVTLFIMGLGVLTLYVWDRYRLRHHPHR